MKVLVDSTMWSLGLRRNQVDLSPAERVLVQELRELIQADQAVLIGLLRQEVLSGIKHQEQFEKIRRQLAAFPNLTVEDQDDLQAAHFFNRCRAGGIAAGPIDMLVCAVADRLALSVYTTDVDFQHCARHLPLQLHAPREPRS